MSERPRRRSSKWDFKEEGSFSPEHIHIPHGEVQKTSTWDEGRSYGTRMSPGHGDWRRQRDRSPREKWDNRSSRNRRSRSRSRSPGHGIRQESVRNERNRSRPGVPCKDFSLGRCRRGDDCPFVHQGIQNYEDSQEIGARRGDISKNSNPRDFREQRAGRGSSDRDRRPPCKFFAAGNCRSGNSCRFSHSAGSESPEKRLDEEKSMLGHNSDKVSKVWEDPRFCGTSSVPDAVRYDDSRGSKRARHSRDNEWSPDGKRDPHFEPDKNKSVEVLGDLVLSPGWNYDSSTQAKDEIQHADRSVAPTRNNENSLEKIGFSQNKEKSLENPVFSQNNLKFSVSDWDGPNCNEQHYQSWDGIAPTTLNVVGQHNDASTMATAPLTQEELFADGKSELYMQDSNTSEVIKNTVDGAQFPQLTDVSGSLAQLLGDGKQLPQLYAALNATGDALPLPHVLVDSTVSAAPLQKANSSDDTLGDTSSPIDSKSIADGAKNLISSDFRSSSHVDKSNNGGTGEAAEESKNKEESKGAGNNGQPENIGGEKKDEEKKGKETKATRAFKFALAEYVKELLKPSWKDGLVGKDDYKTIVKKVVDKVTDSFQGPNIPQTQEKIDNYLTLSKPKLTKLVQAYVEKFQKPK